MYKTKPAMVISGDADRILIHTIDGEERRIRVKDVALLHNGPINSFPEKQRSREAEDALELLQEEHPEGLALISWKEFADLAWGDAKPEHIVVAWQSLLKNPAVELLEGGIHIRSAEECQKLLDKEKKKKEIAETKATFVESFRRAWRKRDPALIEKNPLFQQFFDDLSRGARAVSVESPLARELGIKMTPQAIHEALLATGYWDAAFNPWPERTGCILSLPPEPDVIEERTDLALGRLDLRHLHSYAIDNAWSNDPDDAISIEGDRIWIHVADPASIISPTSKFDSEAMARGSTLYLPEKIVPMLGASLVRALGLGLAPESRALSFGITLREDGRIAQTMIVPSVVKVERLTYEQADTLLESTHSLQKLQALAETRAALRRSQNAVDIEFPEVAIKVSGGKPSFLPIPQTRSARMVQELMILAGEAAARWAYERNIPFPFATQEPPVSASLAGCGTGPSRSLAENYGRRRAMRAALVNSTCSAHAGLGLSFYSQVTSPLRRYQDLLAHYQIHAVLAKEKNSELSAPAINAPAPLDLETVNERLYFYSQQAAKNRQAERDSRAHWTLTYLSRHRDWRGQGMVLDASENGQIFIPEFGYEVQMPIPRGINADETISLTLRRASIPELFASFDVILKND
jgi:exoribonuclease-2